MRDSAEPYHIYRIYELDDRRAKLRIMPKGKIFATQVLAQFLNLPSGVTVDSISVHPENLEFGEEIAIELPATDQ